MCVFYGFLALVFYYCDLILFYLLFVYHFPERFGWFSRT